MEKNRYLPLGSVIKVKDIDKIFMIIGYQIENKDGKIYDYAICEYPQGAISSAFNITTDHSNIEKVLFKGYTDEDFVKRNKYLHECEEEENYMFWGSTKNDKLKEIVMDSNKINVKPVIEELKDRMVNNKKD
jgi:hypothetical protein